MTAAAPGDALAILFGVTALLGLQGCETGGESAPAGAGAASVAETSAEAAMGSKPAQDPSAPPDGLRAALETDLTVVAAGEPVLVRVRVRNPGAGAQPFLPVNTALETPLQADAFEVLLDGNPQPYLGIVAQRLPITADDVIMLPPGERIEQSLDLARYYRMEHPGTYQVRYAPRPLAVGPELGVEPAVVTVEGTGLSITRR